MIDYMDFIKTEIEGLFGQGVLRDIADSIKLYDFYDGKGQIWTVKEGLSYKPTQAVTNLVKQLIKTEARFMMGNEPEIKIVAQDGKANDKALEIEQWLMQALRATRWQDKIIKAARDCFIGKRVALKLVAEKGKKIDIQFRNSMEFAYETDIEDVDKLQKIIFFYQTVDHSDKSKQRIWRQRYEMMDGQCLLTEGVYDGNGKPVEVRAEGERTGLDFIPAMVIINDGLSGDLIGESDVRELMDNQQIYNRLKSDDVDALQFSMFPLTVYKDASQETMDNAKSAPGALIDASTDPASENQVDVSILESQFGYDARIENALNRIKNDMYGMMCVPNVSLEQLKGFATSGKGMKALYWDLMSRCEEKWNAWDAALRWMTESMVKMARVFGIKTLPDVAYAINIDHRYPIPEDEEIERANDMAEVQSQMRSRESFVNKWRPDTDAATELEQIVREQRMLGDDFGQALDSEIAAELET